jgi:hypothetical protein
MKAQILNEKNEVLFTGDFSEMELAYKYLTIPFYILAGKLSLKMADAYKLNAKYWNEKSRIAKSFTLKTI